MRVPRSASSPWSGTACAWPRSALVWVAGLSCARSRLAVVAAVGGTVALVHLPSLWYGFHADDFVMARVWSWRDLAATLVGSFDPSGLLATNFRPLVSLTWAVDHWLWGAWTAGYHLTNLVLHAAAGVVLVFPAPPPATAGLPPRCSVDWRGSPIPSRPPPSPGWSARADSLMAVFYLSCLAAFCAARSRPGGIVVTAVLALGAKEMAVTLPLAALLLDRVLLPREQAPARRPRLQLLVLVTAAYVAFWAALFSGIACSCGRREGRAVGGLRPAPRERLALRGGRPLRAVVPPAALRGLVVHATARVAERIPRAGAAGSWRWPRGGWRSAAHASGGRAATAGLLWAPLTALPLLGLSGLLDLYRVGYLVAVAIAFVVAGIVTRLESSRLAAAVLARRAGGGPDSALPGRRPRLGDARGSRSRQRSDGAWPIRTSRDSSRQEMAQLFADTVERDGPRPGLGSSGALEPTPARRPVGV